MAKYVIKNGENQEMILKKLVASRSFNVFGACLERIFFNNLNIRFFITALKTNDKIAMSEK
jgi:hypothetical protein